MRNRIAALATAAVAVATALLLAVPAQARDGASPPAVDACEADFQPARVAVRERPVEVTVALSEPVVEVKDVVAEEGSGLEVESIERPGRGEGAGADLVVTFDTSEATSGEWEITVHGRTTRCVGTLVVTQTPESPEPREPGPLSR